MYNFLIKNLTKCLIIWQNVLYLHQNTRNLQGTHENHRTNLRSFTWMFQRPHQRRRGPGSNSQDPDDVKKPGTTRAFRLFKIVCDWTPREQVRRPSLIKRNWLDVFRFAHLDARVIPGDKAERIEIRIALSIKFDKLRFQRLEFLHGCSRLTPRKLGKETVVSFIPRFPEPIAALYVQHNIENKRDRSNDIQDCRNSLVFSGKHKAWKPYRYKRNYREGYV